MSFFGVAEFLEKLVSIFKKINLIFQDFYDEEAEIQEAPGDVLPLYLLDIVNNLDDLMGDTQQVWIEEELKNKIRPVEGKHGNIGSRKSISSSRSSMRKKNVSQAVLIRRAFTRTKDKVLTNIKLTQFRTIFENIFPGCWKESAQWQHFILGVLPPSLIPRISRCRPSSRCRTQRTS
jgi:hypothetical protein